MKKQEDIIYPCIVCGELLQPTERKFMLAVEVPYTNLWIHYNCYRNNSENIHEILKEKLIKYLETNQYWHIMV